METKKRKPPTITTCAYKTLGNIEFPYITLLYYLEVIEVSKVEKSNHVLIEVEGDRLYDCINDPKNIQELLNDYPEGIPMTDGLSMNDILEILKEFKMSLETKHMIGNDLVFSTYGEDLPDELVEILYDE